MKLRTISLAHDVPALILSAADRKVLRALKAYAPHLDNESHRAEVIEFMRSVEKYQQDHPELTGEMKASVQQVIWDVDEIVQKALKEETEALMSGKHAPVFEVMGVAESTNMWIFRDKGGDPYRVRKEVQVYNSRKEARAAFDKLSAKNQENLSIHKTVAVLGQ